MVTPNARLKETSIPLQEVDCGFELFSDHLYQNSKSLSDANQLITPINGTSESIDMNAFKSHCLEKSCIDLRVRGSGIEDAFAQVPVSYVNYDGERASSSSRAAHVSSNADNRSVNRYVFHSN